MYTFAPPHYLFSFVSHIENRQFRELLVVRDMFCQITKTKQKEKKTEISWGMKRTKKNNLAQLMPLEIEVQQLNAKQR